MTEPHNIEGMETGAPGGSEHDLADAIGVQYEGIGAGPIMGFIALAMLAVTILVTAGFFWATSYSQELKGELAAEAVYPDIHEIDLKAARKLSQYEVIDSIRGVYRIPIDRAIDLMVNEAYQQPGTYSKEIQLLPGQ